MSTALRPMYQWNTIRWPKIERKVFKLQKRIYRAAQRGDHRQVRRLQKLLLRSHHAKLVAVRQVTPDNRGQKTPGVDGLAALTPPERLALANALPLNGEAAPVRRVYIPKPGTDEQRQLVVHARLSRPVAELVVFVQARQLHTEGAFSFAAESCDHAKLIERPGDPLPKRQLLAEVEALAEQ